jgi:hypothetical protein
MPYPDIDPSHDVLSEPHHPPLRRLFILLTVFGCACAALGLVHLCG